MEQGYLFNRQCGSKESAGEGAAWSGIAGREFSKARLAVRHVDESGLPWFLRVGYFGIFPTLREFHRVWKWWSGLRATVPVGQGIRDRQLTSPVPFPCGNDRSH